jgi:hypothetical protein
MGAGDGSERLNILEAGECQELRDVDLISAAGLGVRDISEPFQFGRNIRRER